MGTKSEIGITLVSVRKNIPRRLRIVAAVACLLLITAACGGGGGSSSKSEPYCILYVSGITGLLAPSATAVQRGIQARVDAINAAGGVNGRKLELTTKDDQSDPTRGVTLVQKAISGSNKPDVVIPGVSSNESLAMAPLLTRSKVVGISSASSAALDNVTKYPYFFSDSPLQQYIVEGAAHFVNSQGGAHTIALVVPNDALGDAIHEHFASAFEKYGIQTKDYRYASDAVDLSPIFQKAIASHPDWIYMDGAGDQVPYILEGRVKANGESIPTVIGGSAGAYGLLKLARGKELENTHVALLPVQAYIPPDKRSPQFKDFFKRVMAQGAIKVPLYAYGNGWDIVGIWAEGARKVKGDYTGAKLKTALEHLPEPTDAIFPLYRTPYTTKSHFSVVKPETFTFGQLVSEKDGMYVVK